MLLNCTADFLARVQASVPKAVPQAPQKDQKKKSGPAAVSKPVSLSLQCPDTLS